MVYVISKDGEPLMPTNRHGKVRRLLKDRMAKVVSRSPFTIQLLYDSDTYTQPITLGVDAGSKKIGVSAVTDTDEVFSAEVELRSDIVKLNADRRAYRRNRRNRKTRYRKPRFLNRAKPKGWLAPSIRNKIDTHLKIINMVHKILPITNIIVETAQFDTQKLDNPDIEGVEYQNGDMKGYYNTREYVLYRDGHKCRHCGGKSKDPILNVHHIESRRTGGNAPNNLVTLCKTCHDGYHNGSIELKIKRGTVYRDAATMNIMRPTLYERLCSIYDNVSITYGYITKYARIGIGLVKSHVNDAFVIARGTTQGCTPHYIMKQVRKCNRKLYKGIRSHIRNTVPRILLGFRRFDKVLWNDIECFIFGRRTSGYFDLRDISGAKISASAKYSDISLLECSGTLLIGR